MRRAALRLKAVDVLYSEASWADVVRESQEVVELALNSEKAQGRNELEMLVERGERGRME